MDLYASAMTSDQEANPQLRSYCWAIMAIFRQTDITFTIVSKGKKGLRFTDVERMHVVSL